MSRFEDVSKEVDDFVRTVRKDYFGELASANIKVLYDTKKRKSKKRIVVSRIQKANDLIKCLTMDDINEEVDYILYIDKEVFASIDDSDKVRLIRRELRHCFVDMEANNDPYSLQDFEISDFYDEIDLNKDDPRWFERVLTVAESIYSDNDR